MIADWLHKTVVERMKLSCYHLLRLDFLYYHLHYEMVIPNVYDPFDCFDSDFSG